MASPNHSDVLYDDHDFLLLLFSSFIIVIFGYIFKLLVVLNELVYLPLFCRYFFVSYVVNYYDIYLLSSAP